MTRRTAKNKSHPAIRTIAFVSLGCPKNLVDSEKMLGLLAEDGLQPVADEAQADAIVINTCGFLEASKEESLGEIKRAAELKQAGTCRRIIVAGCLVQRHRAKLLEWCPEIDALIGVFDRDRIVQAVRGGLPGQKSENALALPVYSSIAGNAVAAQRERGLHEKGYFESDAARLRLTPRHYAYLRISEGCNQNCAFCTIPSIRGKMRSKPVEAILAEARELCADGVFELNLIGQDTTSYGHDIGFAQPGQGLAGMLTALDQLMRAQGQGWLRLMYAYPSCFTDAMIDALAQLPSVVKYVDMPLQHIDDKVLANMRRHTSRKLIEKLLAGLRQRVPGLALRTTFISGYPGETAAQHRRLVQFVREFGFEAMGVFAYSPEPGTPAGTAHARGEGVDPQVVRERVEELMLAQQQVVFARHERLVREGAEMDVLIDSPGQRQVRNATGAGGGTAPPTASGRVPAAGMLYAGRSAQQAPQVDGLTHVVTRQKLAPGELLRCRITDWDGYDLIAQPVEDLEKKMSLKVL